MMTDEKKDAALHIHKEMEKFVENSVYSELLIVESMAAFIVPYVADQSMENVDAWLETFKNAVYKYRKKEVENDAF